MVTVRKERPAEAATREALLDLAYGPARLTKTSQRLREGRTQQIRKMFKAMGHPVAKLKRVAIGPIADPKLSAGDWRELTKRLACVSIHLNHRLLDEARVKMLKDAGLRILVYTVNKPQRAAELLRWGVDSICTDAIDLIGPDFSSAD